jgi:hypothetical protein
MFRVDVALSQTGKRHGPETTPSTFASHGAKQGLVQISPKKTGRVLDRFHLSYFKIIRLIDGLQVAPQHFFKAVKRAMFCGAF